MGVKTCQGYLAGDLLGPLPPPNPDWGVLLLQPDPALPHDGRYEAFALVDDPSLSGCFVQTFIWRRQGTTPGVQKFEIFDDSFTVIESGETTLASFTCPTVVEAPEPGMLWLLGMGLLGLVWSRTKPVGSVANGCRARPVPDLRTDASCIRCITLR